LPLCSTKPCFLSHIDSSCRSAKTECSHSISGYNRILWYKQSKFRELVFLGYMIAKTANPEVGFDIEGDASKEAYLHLVSLRGPEHSAVYYCAASQHSDVEFLLFSTKTLSDGNIRPRLRTPASEV
uniref:Ig-like domain-containing protein n=1 Tax=Salmo trutta TaxID=8032 RepID=A0A674ANK6_SALTR